eukprot:3401050-Rhodomonas_salina.2
MGSRSATPAEFVACNAGQTGAVESGCDLVADAQRKLVERTLEDGLLALEHAHTRLLRRDDAACNRVVDVIPDDLRAELVQQERR